MPTISRVYETVLYAGDLGAALRFYRDVLGLSLAGEFGHLGLRFKLGDGGMLLIFNPAESSLPGREVPSHGTRRAGHVAFSIARGESDEWLSVLKRHDVAVEKVVTWERGARSIYCRDPAGNSVELVDGEWPL